MSTYLASQGIKLISGYDYEIESLQPDQVIVGNTMRRGMAIIEYLLIVSLSIFQDLSGFIKKFSKIKRSLLLLEPMAKQQQPQWLLSCWMMQA